MLPRTQLLVILTALTTCATVSPAVDGGLLNDGAGDSAACVPKALLDACDECWVKIVPGSFTMGSPSTEYGRAVVNENQVDVTLTHAIRMMKAETTQLQWNAMCIANPSSAESSSGIADCMADDCPVGMISFADALEYANRLSTLAGLPACYSLGKCVGEIGHGSLPSLKGGLACDEIGVNAPSVYDCDGYRLPTEAEWEYAARAGTTTAFASGPITDHGPGKTFACEPEPALDGHAWYCINSSPKPPGGPTHPTRMFPPNPWGLFDMAGNAAEWVSDAYDSFGYGPGPLTDPGKLPGKSATRILRGGKALGWPSLLRSAHRLSVPPDYSDLEHGFRLVRTIK